MSTIKVNKIEHTSTTDGGVSIDSSGNVTLPANTKVGTQNLPSAGPLSNRNLIINGAMQVAQRGTSVTGVSNGSNDGYQTLDRFALNFSFSPSGACTISQDTDVPSNEGFSNSYKLDVTTANTSIGSTQRILVEYKIEAQDLRNSGWNYTSASSDITLSFWAKSSKAGTYCLTARANDVGHKYYVFEYTLAANTWKKITHSIPGDSSLVFNNDTGNGLELQWTLAVGSDKDDATADQWNATSASNAATSNQVNFFDSTDNNFWLTGVQLEVGSVATPFEHRSYGDELARCQRYFYKIDGSSSAIRTANGITNVTDAGSNVNGMTKFGVGSVWDGDDGSVVVPLPVTMRADPTTDSAGLRLAAGSSIYNTTTTIQDNRSSIYSGSIQLDNDDSSGMTSGQACMLVFEGDAYLSFSSEL